MRKQIVYTTEERIAHSEDNKLEWIKCGKLLGILFLMLYLLFGCVPPIKHHSLSFHHKRHVSK